jgi:hypothetical protein
MGDRPIPLSLALFNHGNTNSGSSLEEEEEAFISEHMMVLLECTKT